MAGSQRVLPEERQVSEQQSSTTREEAYRAAAAAVDRFLARIGEDTAERVGQVGTAARDRFRADIGRVVDLNLDMVRNAFGLYGSLLDPENFVSTKDHRLDLGSTVPGASATAVLWLHNFADEPMEDLAFVGSRLVSQQSASQEDPLWAFTPSTITVPPQSAVPVLVAVDVPGGTPGGSYSGTVSPQGHEAEPIAIRLEVVAPEPIAHESW